MDHSIVAEGFGVRLRPVRLNDAEFLVWLRNLEHAKGKLGDSAMEVAEQEKWLEAYLHRDGDYYFIIETNSCIPVGTYGLYDVIGKSAEIGRWVMCPDSPATVPAIIPGLHIAFGILALSELRTKVVSTNQSVLKIDQQVGFVETYFEQNAQTIGGKPVDMIHMTMKSEAWPAIREKLTPLACAMEPRVRRWEQKHQVTIPFHK